jgi:hypothetical protein
VPEPFLDLRDASSIRKSVRGGNGAHWMRAQIILPRINAGLALILGEYGPIDAAWSRCFSSVPVRLFATGRKRQPSRSWPLWRPAVSPTRRHGFLRVCGRRILGWQWVFDDADRTREHRICGICTSRFGHIRFFLGLDFLEEFLPPGRIGFMQTVDDEPHQIGKRLQVDPKLARNRIPAPVVSNAIMYFIELEVHEEVTPIQATFIDWALDVVSACRWWNLLPASALPALEVSESPSAFLFDLPVPALLVGFVAC